MALLGRIGMVARWRPVHIGHAPVLRALKDRATSALIGIGSSNRYDARNPFTLEETQEMLRLVLGESPSCTLVAVPDLDDGPRWRAMVVDLFGPLDLFVTDSPYVASLVAGDYRVARPVELVPEEERVPVEGAMVRGAMARGGSWEELVPPEVARYIRERGLDGRFRREFGLETLALHAAVRRRRDVLVG